MAMGSDIYATIYGSFNAATVQVVTNKFIAVSRYVQTPLATAFILYIAIYGWMILRGQVQEPVSEFFRRCFKITVIWFLVTYPLYFYNNFGKLFLNTIPDEIIEAITNGTGNNSIDLFLDQGLKVANAIRAQASWYEIGAMITAWFVEAMALISSVAAFFIFVLSDIVVAMLLILSPIFLSLLLFEVTSRWFWSWVSSLFTFVLVKIFLAVLLALLLGIALTITKQVVNKAGVPGGIVTSSFNIVVVFMVGFFVFLKLYDIASAISGGVSVSMGQFGQSLRSSVTRTTQGTGSAYRGAMFSAGRLSRGLQNLAKKI